MKLLKRSFAFLFVILLLTGMFAQAATPPESVSATILFTHDMHSHFLPSFDENGNETGGMTRLATALNSERENADGAVITVDGGDFSMGTLFQTIFSEEAPELRTLGMMGYDVATLGNHEFDYRGSGLAKMLRAAMEKTDEANLMQNLSSSQPAEKVPYSLPPIVLANYLPPQQGDEGYDETAQEVQDAFDDYGIQDYIMIEKDGVRFAVFGLEGKDSDECAPMSGMVLEPAIDAAKRVVKQIQETEDYDFIIALSHSGTWPDPKKSEDELLAKAVDGIDLIVSGHTHTTLPEPIVVNNTLIVSCGEYTNNLGVLKLTKSGGAVSVDDYRLVPIDDSIEPDPVVSLWTEYFKEQVSERYLSNYGMEFEDVLATSPFAFTPTSRFGAKQEGDSLGDLISDSYIYAVQQAEGDDYVPVDMAVVAQGVVRGSFPAGDITVSDAFNVSSLGYGADGTPGYPLVSVYLTGKELKAAFEVDASVTPLMSAAQLYVSGMGYTFNTNRMIFDKVTDCWQLDTSKTPARVPIENDKLYRVVTGLYSGQMLGAVKGKSFGILSITPKDKDGNVIEDFEDHIIHDKNGNEVKEWYALATYLKSMGTVSPQYAQSGDRKLVQTSANIIDLVKNPGWITLLVIGIALLLIVAIVLIVRAIVRRRRQKVHK